MARNRRAVNAARHACLNSETSSALNTAPTSEKRFPLWRRAAVLPLAWLIRAYWATLRLHMPPEDREEVMRTSEPTVFILWHNRLFLTGKLLITVRKGHKLYSLISRSGDGDWLAILFSSLGFDSVRGSSSRGGREAAEALVDKLCEGHDAGITPDGPRGPVYQPKPGALTVARRSKARMLLVGMDFHSSWRLRSWDGFYIPKPFSRIDLRFEPFSLEGLDDPDEALRALGAHLIRINPDRRPAPPRRTA